MTRLDAMLERLPPPLAVDEGSLLRDVLRLVDGALAVTDEDMDRVQRSHWVGHAFDLGDLGRLGSLFDVAPAPWELARLFRARLTAEVGALLAGPVTVAQLERAVRRIVDAAEQALHLASEGGPTLEEFPSRVARSTALLDRRGVVRVHDTFVAVHRGLEASPAQLALVGVAGGTPQPVLVNRTTGAALGWDGTVPAGATLRVTGDGDRLAATLDGEDVTGRLWSTSAFGPDRVIDDDDGPRPLLLGRGDNVLVIETMARYDRDGIGRAAYAVAEPLLVQGRFAGADVAGSPFDDAVFTTGPIAAADIWWTERRPAAFDVVVPWRVVRRVAGRRADPEADRASLLRLLQARVDRLRAAGVQATVRATALEETQPAHDRVAVLAPVHTTEVASAGEDRLTATSARFDRTPRDGARFD